MSKDLLLKIFEEAKKFEYKDLIEYLEKLIPNKLNKVIEVLKRGITKYTYKPSNRIVWTALGENQEHLIYPRLYCSCQDFYKNVVIMRKKELCKHLIAQVISEAIKNYNQVELNDQEFKVLLNALKLKI